MPAFTPDRGLAPQQIDADLYLFVGVLCFVDGRHARYIACLQCFEIEEPTQSRGNAGRDEKKLSVPSYIADTLCFVAEKYNAPREQKDNGRADGGG